MTVLNKWYYDLFLKFQNPCIHMTTILVLGNQLALNDGCTTNDYHLWPSLLTSHEKNKWERRQGKSDIALVSPSGLPAFTRHHPPTVFQCFHPIHLLTSCTCASSCHLLQHLPPGLQELVYGVYQHFPCLPHMQFIPALPGCPLPPPYLPGNPSVSHLTTCMSYCSNWDY